MDVRRRQPIGVELVKRGIVKEEDIEKALAYQREHPGRKLGDILYILDLCDPRILIEAIGDILGYRLIANDITDGKGGMTIDFNSNSAPFNTNDSYIGNEQYTTNDDLAFTIFDSIEKTLQEYFGQNLDVWFSLDSGSITINDVTIPITEPYQGSNYYLK